MMENPIMQLEQLTLNAKSKSFLKEIAKWAFFFAILGYISIGLFVILGIFSGVIFGALPESQTQQIPFDLGFTMTIVYLVLAAIYFFPVYYLMQFSVRMKKALATKNDDTLANAFEVLKSHYKFIGVFTIIFISLYALVFVASMLGVLV